MMADLWTVVWKDWKEFLFSRGSLRGGTTRLLLLVFVFGVFLPLQVGRAWVETPIVLVYWAWVPLMLVSTMVADSIAGERERHTLETLLSTRMPDQPLLYGKVLAAILYGWGTTMVSLVLGLVVVNVAQGQGHLLFYTPLVAVGGPTMGLLMSGLAATAGVLVSLRAATVRQAAQTLSIATMAFLLVPLFATSLVRKAAPAGSAAQLGLLLGSANWMAVLAAVALVLAVVDLALLAIARAHFRRSRLILD